MKRLALALFLGTAIAAAAEPPPGLEVSQFVFLHRKAGIPPLGERETVRLQQEHLAWLGRLYDAGKVLLSGPIAGSGDLQGVLVLRVPTREDAEAILAGDPWIREGRIAPKILPWWSETGPVRKPEHLLHVERVWLGIFRRPDGAPDYPAERLREIQAGHMKNLEAMAASGDLVLAGPFESDGALRGVLVFRTKDPERIRAMVAEDPAVKAGRLGVDLYPWSLPKGSLPAPAVKDTPR